MPQPGEQDKGDFILGTLLKGMLCLEKPTVFGGLLFTLSVFAPGDLENISTKTMLSDVKERDDLLAIYAYESGVTLGGTFEVILFSKIRGIWRFRSVSVDLSRT